MYTVSILGAGNVATHISRHLFVQGYRINHVWSRTRERAGALAESVGARALWAGQKVPDGDDFYLIAVPDHAMAALLARYASPSGIWVHMAGAVPMQVFEGKTEHHGVLYPLQSISRDDAVEFREIPLLLEASSAEVMHALKTMAGDLSSVVREVDSQRRLAIHLAAVFANNFSNHMVHLASRIMQEQDENPELLLPLLRETVAKIERLGPGAAQTGPALRNDRETMDRHREILKAHPEWEKLYTFVSRSIQDEQL